MPVFINDYILYKVYEEMIYAFLNFNGYADEV